MISFQKTAESVNNSSLSLDVSYASQDFEDLLHTNGRSDESSLGSSITDQNSTVNNSHHESLSTTVLTSVPPSDVCNNPVLWDFSKEGKDYQGNSYNDWKVTRAFNAMSSKNSEECLVYRSNSMPTTTVIPENPSSRITTFDVSPIKWSDDTYLDIPLPGSCIDSGSTFSSNPSLRYNNYGRKSLPTNMLLTSNCTNRPADASVEPTTVESGGSDNVFSVQAGGKMDTEVRHKRRSAPVYFSSKSPLYKDYNNVNHGPLQSGVSSSASTPFLDGNTNNFISYPKLSLRDRVAAAVWTDQQRSLNNSTGHILQHLKMPVCH